MNKRIYPPRPHCIVGYTGHCPKYRYIQMEQGKPHEFCHRQCRDMINNNGTLANTNVQDRRLTFTEIDFVMAHERDPNYTLPKAPSPANFLTYLNKPLGLKHSRELVPTVAAFHRKVNQHTLENTLFQRNQLYHNSSIQLHRTTKEQTCSPPLLNTNGDSQDLTAIKSEKEPVNYKVEYNEQAMLSQQKAIKGGKKIFNIYKNASGLIPRYAGHVPGACFRFGSTFGHDSFNARKWLTTSQTKASTDIPNPKPL